MFRSIQKLMFHHSWWLMPIIPATGEVENMRIVVQSQLR
jgi:hypothetical protein